MQAIETDEVRALPEYGGQGASEEPGSPAASEADLGDEMEAALRQSALKSVAEARCLSLDPSLIILPTHPGDQS